MSCTKQKHDCSGLPFEKMQPLHTYSEGVTIVNCTHYEPTRPPPLMRVRVNAGGERAWLDGGINVHK